VWANNLIELFSINGMDNGTPDAHVI